MAGWWTSISTYVIRGAPRALGGRYFRKYGIVYRHGWSAVYWQSCSLVFTHSLWLKNRYVRSLRATVTRNQRDKTDESKRHWEPFLIPLCPYSFNDCEQARVTFSITAFISRRVRVQSNWLKLDRFVCFFHSLLGLSGLLVFLPSCTTR